MIFRKIPVYNYGKLDFKPIKNTELFGGKFYIKLPPLPNSFKQEKTLLNIPNTLEIRAICRSFDEKNPDNYQIHREGGFYFNEKDEWLLEAVCHMETADKTANLSFTLRLPLSAPFIKDSEIGLVFDGAFISFVKDGEILNQNSGMDNFCAPDGEIFADELFKGTEIAAIDKTNVTYREEKTNGSGAFYFPVGYNTYVGDVMTFYHDGVYHLMYLIDRRHHGSRNGAGAHYIFHMTSENLVDWYEQTPITEISAPYLTYGTGTMLFHNGKYYMTYGFHTERYKGANKQIEPRYLENEGYERVSIDNILSQNALPAGASYSVSENGIDFKESGVLFHSARNPSAFLKDDGGIVAYCGYGGEGVFEADSFEEPFKRSNKNFDFVKGSVMKNTSECPCFFSWNGYKYLIVGFTGYFRTTEKNSDNFVDATSLGENIYDGLAVPMVTTFKDNRRIIAGWVCSHLVSTKTELDWGGALVQRELVQEKDGRLSMKWVPEMLPELLGENLIKGDIKLGKTPIERHKNYSLCLEIDPKSAEKIALSLDDGEKACTLELDIKEKTAQINRAEIGCFADKIETPRAQFEKIPPDNKSYHSTTIRNIPSYAANYTLPDVRGIDKPFKLKVMLRYSKKMRACVIDAEINEANTLISVRSGFFPTSLSLLGQGDFSVKDAVLKEFATEE